MARRWRSKPPPALEQMRPSTTLATVQGSGLGDLERRRRGGWRLGVVIWARAEAGCGAHGGGDSRPAVLGASSSDGGSGCGGQWQRRGALVSGGGGFRLRGAGRRRIRVSFAGVVVHVLQGVPPVKPRPQESKKKGEGGSSALILSGYKEGSNGEQ